MKQKQKEKMGKRNINPYTKYRNDGEFLKLEEELMANRPNNFLGIDIQSKDKFSNEELEMVKDELCKTTYTNDIERGSASCPLYNGNWCIDIFGNVWCDIELKNKTKLRANYIPVRDIIYLEKH